VNVCEKDSGMTPLMIASYGNNPYIVELLLKSGADVSAKTPDGATPLLHSLAYGASHHGITELLIAHGADLKAVTEKKETFLHHAAYLGNIELARLYLDKGGAVDPANEEGQTPLHCAVRSGNWEMVSLLKQRGANPSIKDKEGISPAELIDKRGIAFYNDLPFK